MDNLEFWTLGVAILALIVAVVSFFVKSKTIVEYKNDLNLSTMRRFRHLEEEQKRLQKEKPTLVKEGNLRYFMDDEGNTFGRNIIHKK